MFPSLKSNLKYKSNVTLVLSPGSILFKALFFRNPDYYSSLGFTGLKPRDPPGREGRKRLIPRAASLQFHFRDTGCDIITERPAGWAA